MAGAMPPPVLLGGRNSLDDITSRYGLDYPGLESRWGREFLAIHNGPETHPASFIMVTGSFQGQRVCSLMLITHLPLVPGCEWVGAVLPLLLYPCTGIFIAAVKEKLEPYLYSPFWDFMTCYREKFTFTFLINNFKYNPCIVQYEIPKL
jgi:hypothetical protein